MNYINTTSNQYPITEREIKLEYPNVSFGKPFAPPEPYAEVIATDRPEYDQVSQSLGEVAPLLSGGIYTQRWEVVELGAEVAANNLAALLLTRRTDLIAQIDVDVDAIYAAAVGNREPEYALAATQARAFKAAGYTGEVPPSVSAWAAAKGWTATESADDILAAAERLNGARDAIRAARLLRKEQAKVAAGLAALVDLQAQWSAFVASVRAQLGV